MVWSVTRVENSGQSAISLPRAAEALSQKDCSPDARQRNLINHFLGALHILNRDSHDNGPVDIDKINWGAMPRMLANTAVTSRVLTLLYDHVQTEYDVIARYGLLMPNNYQVLAARTASSHKGVNTLRRFRAVQAMILDAKATYAERTNKVNERAPIHDNITEFPRRPVEKPPETIASDPSVAA